MKLPLNRFLAISAFLVVQPLDAAPLYKIDNTDNLNLLTSWSTTSGAQTPNPVALDPADVWYFNDLTMLGSKTISLGADITIAGLGLDNTTATSPGNTFNVVINSGNTLTLNGGTISGTGVSGGVGYSTAGIVLNRSVGGGLTIDAGIIVGATQQWVTSRGLTIGGNVDLGSGTARTLTLNTATTTLPVITGTISGTTGNLIKSGTGTLHLNNGANTFGGSVAVSGGILRIEKLANGGSNSSIGSGSSAIALNGGTLNYTGSTIDTTNRAIEMRAGASINNNGTGTISFTAPNVSQTLTATARTMTLGGSNASDNTFGAILGDSGTAPNISRLQKSGTGKWIVTGAHTYTGATIINQGTLVARGGGVLGGAAGSTGDESNIWFTSVQSNGALHFETTSNLGPADQIRFRNTGGTAGSGGALVYTGTTDQTLGKTIQCDSSIGIRIESNSVGGKLVFNGAFSDNGARPLYLGGTGTGANEFQTVISGSRTVTKRDPGTWVLSAANTYTGNTVVNDGTLAVNSSGSLRFRPTTTGVNNAVSGSATATLTFTGTVSLDLSSANATAGNSWTLFNLGSFSGPTPTLTPAAVTSTTLGSFAETSSGVWELPVTGAKWVFTTSDGKLVYSAGFSSWASANAPGQTIGQDHDGDGLPNGVEYFMGLSGSGFTANPVPNASNVVSWPKGTSYTGTYGTDYVIQISSDLGLTDPWTNVPVGSVTIDPDSVDYDLDTTPAGTRKFARLKVTGP